MTISELQFCRRLLDQGVPLEKGTVLRIVQHALELTVRNSAVRHDEQCKWWLGRACDCPESR